MERLTERDEFGNANIIGVDSMDLQCNLGFDEFNRVTNALNKLAEYEDLEEQGKLLKLPCDIVWFICDKKTKYASVMSKPIRDLTIFEIEGIDEKGYYWSTRDKALAALKEL